MQKGKQHKNWQQLRRGADRLISKLREKGRRWEVLLSSFFLESSREEFIEMVISMLSLKSEVMSGAAKEVGGQRESGKVFCMNLVFFTEVSPCLHLFGFILKISRTRM